MFGIRRIFSADVFSHLQEILMPKKMKKHGFQKHTEEGI
jgi:hypothetical protein